jgi:hypothetical protein
MFNPGLESVPSAPKASNTTTNKRTLSEVDDVEGREEKKIKHTAFEDESDRPESKDRKKRKKKKKKLPVVVAAEKRAPVHARLPSLSAQNVQSLETTSRILNGASKASPRRQPMSSETQVSSKDDPSLGGDVEPNHLASTVRRLSA